MINFIILIISISILLLLFYLFWGLFMKSSLYNAIYYLIKNKVFNKSYCKYCVFLYTDSNGDCYCMKSGKVEDTYYDIVINPNLCSFENKNNDCKKFILDYSKFRS